MQASPPLKAGKTPPLPAARQKARSSTVKRARAAVRFMERNGWVTDDVAYKSRWSALNVTRRLRAAVEEHEGVPARELTWRVWLSSDGWRWSLGLKHKIREQAEARS